jgi:hypothetical protein
VSEWQTIESVPCSDVEGNEEPTRVLLWNPEYGVQVGYAYRRKNGDPRPMVAGFAGMTWTHWAHMPAPPALEEAK